MPDVEKELKAFLADDLAAKIRVDIRSHVMALHLAERQGRAQSASYHEGAVASLVVIEEVVLKRAHGTAWVKHRTALTVEGGG